MQQIANPNFILKRTNGARQVMLLSHGGWEAKHFPFLGGSGDGYVRVPAGMKIHFYTPDTEVGKGVAAITEILSRPEEAYHGMMQRAQLSSFWAGALESGDVTTQQAADQLIKQTLPYVPYAVESAAAGTNIKNYELSMHTTQDSLTQQWDTDSASKSTINNFKTYGPSAPNFSADVDFLILNPSRLAGATGSVSVNVHLSDVFAFLRQQGIHYDVLHYCPCRVRT